MHNACAGVFQARRSSFPSSLASRAAWALEAAGMLTGSCGVSQPPAPPAEAGPAKNRDPAIRESPESINRATGECRGPAVHPAFPGSAEQSQLFDTLNRLGSRSMPACQTCPSGTELSGEKVTRLEPLHCHEEGGSWSQREVGHSPEPGHSTSVTGLLGKRQAMDEGRALQARSCNYAFTC